MSECIIPVVRFYMAEQETSAQPTQDRVEVLRARVAASELRALDAEARLRFLRAELKLAELTPKLDALKRKATA
jgi:hypothetical protein